MPSCQSGENAELPRSRPRGVQQYNVAMGYNPFAFTLLSGGMYWIFLMTGTLGFISCEWEGIASVLWTRDGVVAHLSA